MNGCVGDIFTLTITCVSLEPSIDRQVFERNRVFNIARRISTLCRYLGLPRSPCLPGSDTSM